MNKYVCFSLVGFLLCTTAAMADQITMKDGSIYEGYVSQQCLGRDSSVITFSRCIKTFPVSDISGGMDAVMYEVSELSPQMLEWAESNNKLETYGKKKFLPVTRMNINGFPANEFYILEHGTKYIKCFCIADGVAFVKSSEIHCIQKQMRNSTLLTDVDDIVKTEDKTFSGVILEQYPGKQMKIWNKKDNHIHVMNYNELKSVGKDRFNPDYPIWSQAKYLEKITTTKGESKFGLIMENGLDGNFNLIFATPDGDSYTTMQYSYKDVVSVSRMQNPDYKPLYDIILQPGESRINRDNPIAFAKVQQYQYTGPFQMYYVTPQDTVGMQHVRDRHVTIETNTDDIRDIYIFKATEREGKSPASKDPVMMLTYTYEDLFQSNIDYDFSISINGTSKIAFDVPEPGHYFVYLRKINKCWLFKY